MFSLIGVRIFIPNPVSKTIEYIGGPHVILGLIAMSNDIESFYASVKAFVCIIKANKQMQNELLRTRAYQVNTFIMKDKIFSFLFFFKILGFLYLKKRHLINSHILHLTCTLVGTIDTIRESTAITNPAAFEHLLCEFEVNKTVFFFEIIISSSFLRSGKVLMWIYKNPYLIIYLMYF